MAELDGNERKKLYSKLYNDPDTKAETAKYSFKEWEKSFLDDAGKRSKIGLLAVGKNWVSDYSEFRNKYAPELNPPAEPPATPVAKPAVAPIAEKEKSFETGGKNYAFVGQPQTGEMDVMVVDGKSIGVPQGMTMVPEGEEIPEMEYEGKMLPEVTAYGNLPKPGTQLYEEIMRTNPPVGSDEYNLKIAVQNQLPPVELGAGGYGGVLQAPFETKAQIEQEAQSPAFRRQKLAEEMFSGNVPAVTQEDVRKAQEGFRKATKEQQQAALIGSSGAELKKATESEKQSFGERSAAETEAMWEQAKNAGINIFAGLATVMQTAALNETPMDDYEREYYVGKAWEQMYETSDKANKDLQNELYRLNVSNDVLNELEKGNYSKIPEATLQTIANVGVSAIASLFTAGGSMYFQSLPDVYREGVDAIAKEQGITPEEVIRNGDDAKIVAQTAAGIIAALERAGAGRLSKSIANKGGYKAVRDYLIRKGFGKTIGRAAGLGYTSAGEGFTEYVQQGTQQLSRIASASKDTKRFLEKLPKEFFSRAAAKERLSAGVGGLVGGGGMVSIGRGVGAAFQKGPDITQFSPEVQGNEIIQEAARGYQDNIAKAEEQGRKPDAFNKRELNKLATDPEAWVKGEIKYLTQTIQDNKKNNIDSKVEETKLSRANALLAQIKAEKKVMEQAALAPAQEAAPVAPEAEVAPAETVTAPEVVAPEATPESTETAPVTEEVPVAEETIPVAPETEEDYSFLEETELTPEEEAALLAQEETTPVAPAEEEVVTEQAPAEPISPATEEEKQKSLEDEIESIKAQINSLRSEDGSVPSGGRAEFDRLLNLLTQATANAKRGNSTSVTPIRVMPEDIATQAPAFITDANEKAEAADLIEQAIQSSKTWEEAMRKIRKLGYVFNANDNMLLANYLKDRFNPDAPRIGNNKDSFQAWVNGKTDADLAAPEVVAAAPVEEAAPEAPAAPMKEVGVGGIIYGHEDIVGNKGLGDVRNQLPEENSGVIIANGKDGNQYAVAFSRKGGDRQNIFEQTPAARPGHIYTSVKIDDPSNAQEVEQAKKQAEAALAEILPTVKGGNISASAVQQAITDFQTKKPAEPVTETPKAGSVGVEDKKAEIVKLNDEIDSFDNEYNSLVDIVNKEGRRLNTPKSKNEIKLNELQDKINILRDKRDKIEQSLKETPQAEASAAPAPKGKKKEALVQKPKREDFPESQSNTRTPVTQRLLDYFADVFSIPKFTDDLSKGTYTKWLQNANNTGYGVALKLNAPRQAFDVIAQAEKERSEAAAPAPKAETKQEAPKTEAKPVSTTPQEGATVEIPAQRAEFGTRKMVFKDGEWKQNVGGDILKVGPAVQQQAQEAFAGKEETKPVETKEGGAKESLGKRLKGDALLNAEDTLAELADNGATINPDGTVVVYHRTTKDKADAIVKNNEMFGLEDGVFFSTSEKGQAEGYGDVVVKMNVPIEQIQIDDTFGNEAHVKIPTKKANQKISVSKFAPQIAKAETKTEAAPKEEGKKPAPKEEWIGKTKEQYISDRTSEILAASENYQKKIVSKDKADQKTAAYLRDEAGKKAEQEYDKLFSEALKNKTLPNEYKPNYLLTSTEKVDKDKKRYTEAGYPQNHNEKLSREEHKEEVQSAVDNGLYAKAIEDGVLSYDEAAKIIESAGIKVPQSLISTPSSTTSLASQVEDMRSLPPAKRKAAQQALEERYGKEDVAKMIEITANFTKIIDDLEKRGVVKIDCP